MVVAKLDNLFGRVWLICLVAVCFSVSVPAATTITFTLDEPCGTSAGVYRSDGTLVRTLWSNVRYNKAGTYSTNWDGNDDSGTAVTAGTYMVKVLENNVHYVWNGVIGNTSSAMWGPNVMVGDYFMEDLAISGTNAFFCSGYSEGVCAFSQFYTGDTTCLVNKWFWDIDRGYRAIENQPGNSDRDWRWAAADTNWIYFACRSTFNPNTGAGTGWPGCIVASKVSDQSLALFANGVVITNCGDAFPNGIYAGTQPGLSGLAVQANSNILAAAVWPDNKIYFFDKLSGASNYNVTVTSPGRMAFDLNGTLWAVSGSNSVVCITNVNGCPGIAKTISNFSQALAVAVCPTNADIVLVADGGANQQVVAIDTNGVSLWTYGLPGGYVSNGPAVQTNKFYFQFEAENLSGAFITFAPDGTFWVNDGGNERTMHFDLNRNYLGQIMYQPFSYTVSADKNNSSRIFNRFLEFSVDYTKPLSNGWTLVNNWKALVDTNHLSFDAGLYQVATFTNGRTYAMITDVALNNNRELCELATNGLRITGSYLPPPQGWTSFGPDGSLRYVNINTAQWYLAPLSGFDSSNNPTWGIANPIASATTNAADPYPRTGAAGRYTTCISTNNVLVSFDSTLNNGFHLGGIAVGTTNWLWKAAPPGDLDNHGTYEIDNGLTYAGSDVQAVGRNIVFGFHGEFFRHQAQAGQHMHYYDDGLFIGQFGESSLGHTHCVDGAIPAFAGNGFGPVLAVTTNGDYYIWENDESAHAPQRWQLVNVKDIREAAGSGVLNSTITVTNQSCPFPVAVRGLSGNQGGQLAWNAVAGASSYNVRYSLINGGPYQMIAGSTTGTTFDIGGLTNGLTYYFAVGAVLSGVEGVSSEQVQINPFDTSKNVMGAGSVNDDMNGALMNYVTAGNVASNLPSFIGMYRNVAMRDYQDITDYGMGNLSRTEIGGDGYVIYDFNGPGNTLTNLAAGWVISINGGLSDQGAADIYFSADGAASENYMLGAKSAGSIAIQPPDANYHYLTVISPPIYNAPREFVMTLTSTNGDSTGYSVNEVTGDVHTFQFLFRGSVTLQADGTGGSGATIQALFLDDLGQSMPGLMAPPTGLHLAPH